jgi:hypothetical protein
MRITDGRIRCYYLRNIRAGIRLPINQLFGFRTELKGGSLDILKRTWEKAKQYLQENNEVK